MTGFITEYALVLPFGYRGPAQHAIGTSVPRPSVALCSFAPMIFQPSLISTPGLANTSVLGETSV